MKTQMNLEYFCFFDSAEKNKYSSFSIKHVQFKDFFWFNQEFHFAKMKK